MGARQGRVPFAFHRELVDLVAQSATRYPVDHRCPPRAELAALDVPKGGLQLLLGVSPPAAPGTHHWNTTDACRSRRRRGHNRSGHSRFRAVTRAETALINVTSRPADDVFACNTGTHSKHHFGIGYNGNELRIDAWCAEFAISRKPLPYTANIYKVLRDVNVTETIRWNSRLLVNCTLSWEKLIFVPLEFSISLPRLLR